MRMEEEVIVIDCGSESTRIGMAGDAAPALIDRTVLGKPKRRESIASDGKRGVFVGQDALQKHSILNLKHPVEKGLIVGKRIVFQIAWVDDRQFSSYSHSRNSVFSSLSLVDWDGIEQLWAAYFEELDYDTEAHPMFVLDSPFCPDASRDRLVTLMVF